MNFILILLCSLLWSLGNTIPASAMKHFDGIAQDVVTGAQGAKEYVARGIRRAITPPPPSRKLFDPAHVVICFTHPHWSGRNIFVREVGSGVGIVESHPTKGKYVRHGFCKQFHTHLARQRNAALARTAHPISQRRLRKLMEDSVRFYVVEFEAHDNDATAARIMKDTLENVSRGTRGQADISVMIHGNGFDPLAHAITAIDDVSVYIAAITVFSPEREAVDVMACTDNVELRRRVGRIEHHFITAEDDAAGATDDAPPVRAGRAMQAGGVFAPALMAALSATPSPAGAPPLPMALPGSVPATAEQLALLAAASAAGGGIDAPQAEALLAQLAGPAAARIADGFVSEHRLVPPRRRPLAAWLRDNEDIITRIAVVVAQVVVVTAIGAIVAAV